MEILIVVAIMGLVMGVAVPSINSLTHFNLRKSATTLSGTIRYLYNQAALKGLCMRMVFDLKDNKYLVEASTEGNCLIDAEQKDASNAKRKEKEKERKEKLKKEGSESGSESSIGGWNGEKPISLEKKKFQFSAVNGDLLKLRGFPAGIRIHGVFTSRQKEIYTRTQGPKKIYLHCFPLGYCERSIIYLEDTSGTILSLEVMPLTGRVKIHKGKIELKDYHKDRTKGEDND